MTGRSERRVRRSAAELSGSRKLNRSFFLVLLALALVLVFFVARSYLLPLTLAAIAAALFHPLYKRILRSVHSRETTAALVSLLIFCLIIVVPVALLAYLITQNVLDLMRLVNQNLPQLRNWLQQLEEAIGRLPFVEGQRVSDLIDSERLLGVIQQAGSRLVGAATGLAGDVVRLLLLFFVFLYSLFFLLRDGGKGLRWLAEALPLPEGDRLALIDKFVSVSRATLKSTFLIGGAQGVIGGLLFLALRIPGAVLVGVLFLVLAAIPGLGPVVIWLPTTAALVAARRYWAAAFMLAVGGGLIPLVDYLLRPRLVGQDTRLHPLLVFIGVLGGVSLFGIWGLLFGPLAMSLLVTLLAIFKRIFGRELRGI